MSTALCQSFRDLAALTCQRMDAAVETGLNWNEETNTETLLLELRERHPTQVAITAFTKPQEAANGADWEWWIRDAGQWLGMRVQAKRTIKGRQSFYGLRTYGAGTQPNTQVDTLIMAARHDGFVPVYCFYVSSHAKPWKAPNGCMTGHAEAVRAVPSSKYSDLATVVVPWQDLVCPKAVKNGAARRHAGVAALEGSLRAAGVKARTEITLRTTLPDYAQHLLQAQVSDRRFTGRDVLAAANAAERGIRGILVMDTMRRVGGNQ